jgi:hypothetical protein
MTNDDEQKTKECAEDVQEFIRKALYQYEPELISALLVINGFSMYKSMFTDEEFEMICKKIYDDRKYIKEF